MPGILPWDQRLIYRAGLVGPRTDNVDGLRAYLSKARASVLTIEKDLLGAGAHVEEREEAQGEGQGEVKLEKAATTMDGASSSSATFPQ